MTAFRCIIISWIKLFENKTLDVLMFSAFISSLLSYLLVFAVFVTVIVLAVVIGILLRKLVDKTKRVHREE